MQLRYRFFMGGDWNPFKSEEQKALERLAEERSIKDPDKEKRDSEVLPTLDSWPDYVLAASKSTFWKSERDICLNETEKTVEIEELWREANESGDVGDFLKKIDAEEVEKAMCYYMALCFERFGPNNYAVDFRLYFTESNETHSDNDTLSTLTPYEE